MSYLVLHLRGKTDKDDFFQTDLHIYYEHSNNDKGYYTVVTTKTSQDPKSRGRQNVFSMSFTHTQDLLRYVNFVFRTFNSSVYCGLHQTDGEYNDLSPHTELEAYFDSKMSSLRIRPLLNILKSAWVDC